MKTANRLTLAALVFCVCLVPLAQYAQNKKAAGGGEDQIKGFAAEICRNADERGHGIQAYFQSAADDGHGVTGIAQFMDEIG